MSQRGLCVNVFWADWRFHRRSEMMISCVFHFWRFALSLISMLSQRMILSTGCGTITPLFHTASTAASKHTVVSIFTPGLMFLDPVTRSDATSHIKLDSTMHKHRKTSLRNTVPKINVQGKCCVSYPGVNIYWLSHLWAGQSRSVAGSWTGWRELVRHQH